MKNKNKRKFPWVRVVLSLVIVCLGVLGFVFRTQIENKINDIRGVEIEEVGFEMSVVDVGQGDAIYLQFNDNENMLIDCGPSSSRNSLKSFFEQKQITNLSYLVYTHSDEDHIGGGYAVFDYLNVEVLYRPKLLSSTEVSKFGNPHNYNVKDTKAYDKSIMCAYDEEGCDIRYSFEGEEIVKVDYTIKFLNPDQDNYNLSSKSNSYSAVLMVETCGRKILLTGDAETETENRLISTYKNELKADILKVSHHGSSGATSSKFLEAVRPDYALISVGENQWKMPTEEVLTRLKNANVKNVCDTKSSGTLNLVISTDGVISLNGVINKFRIDLPIYFSVLALLIILVWGIRFKKPKQKSKTKKK